MTPLDIGRAHRPSGGFMDNASALPTTPPDQHHQRRRTFDPSAYSDAKQPAIPMHSSQ